MDKDPQTPGSQNKNTAATGAPVAPNVDAMVSTDVLVNTEIPVSGSASAETSASDRVTVPQVPVQPVAEAPKTTPVVEPATPPKKKRTGLIVALVVIIILLVAGIGAVLWYFLLYNTPEKAAFDAVSNFLQAENVTVSGKGSVTISDYDDSYTEISYTLNSKTKTFEAGSVESNFKAEHYEADGTKDEFAVNLDLGAAVFSEGVFYFQVGNLMDTVDAAMKNEEIIYDDLPNYGQSLYDLGKEIDGEWWRISVDEILDEIGEWFDQDVAPAKKLYTCVVDVYKDNPSQELAMLYRRSPFVVFTNVKETAQGTKLGSFGKSAYTISFDYDNMANFVNAIPESNFAHGYIDCVNDFIDEIAPSSSSEHLTTEDFPEVTASELRQSFEADFSDVYFIIADFSHQLASIVYETEDSSARLDFDYGKVTVEQPSKYRSITELFDDIIEIIEKASLDFDADDDYDWDDEDWDSDWDYSEYGYINSGTYSMSEYDNIECDIHEYLDDSDSFVCWVYPEGMDDDWLNEEI